MDGGGRESKGTGGTRHRWVRGCVPDTGGALVAPGLRGRTARGILACVDPDALHAPTFYAVMAAWMAFGLAFLLRRRPPEAANRHSDRKGVWGLAVQGAGYAVVWAVRRSWGSPIVEMPAPVLAGLSALAVALAWGSVLLALWAVRTLGRQWALAARLVEGHELVTAGPYRLVRNPIYTGMLGMLVATGLALSRPAGLAVGVAVFWAGTVVRVRAEERLLRRAFGEAWVEWASRTAALVPGIW